MHKASVSVPALLSSPLATRAWPFFMLLLLLLSNLALLFHSPFSATAPEKGGWESPGNISPQVGIPSPRQRQPWLARGEATTKSRSSSGKGDLSSLLAHPPFLLACSPAFLHHDPQADVSQSLGRTGCGGCGATSSQVFWDRLGWMATTEVTKS